MCDPCVTEYEDILGPEFAKIGFFWQFGCVQLEGLWLWGKWQDRSCVEQGCSAANLLSLDRPSANKDSAVEGSALQQYSEIMYSTL